MIQQNFYSRILLFFLSQRCTVHFKDKNVFLRVTASFRIFMDWIYEAAS